MAACIFALFVLLPGCRSSYASPCEAAIACEGGNAADIDACVEESRGLEAIAAAYDCEDAFEKYFECLESKSVCKDGNYTTEGQCKAESDALEACQTAASGRS